MLWAEVGILANEVNRDKYQLTSLVEEITKLLIEDIRLETLKEQKKQQLNTRRLIIISNFPLKIS